jgi:DNA-binding winged helix-turn-helix (wHTH) protein
MTGSQADGRPRLVEPPAWDDDGVLLLIDEHIELDDALFELRRDGALMPLEPQTFDVLLYLVRHRDRVVPKEELMDGVWGGRFVTESAVTSRIKQIRRALGDDGHQQRVLRTVHGAAITSWHP